MGMLLNKKISIILFDGFANAVIGFLKAIWWIIKQIYFIFCGYVEWLAVDVSGRLTISILVLAALACIPGVMIIKHNTPLRKHMESRKALIRKMYSEEDIELVDGRFILNWRRLTDEQKADCRRIIAELRKVPVERMWEKALDYAEFAGEMGDDDDRWLDKKLQKLIWGMHHKARMTVEELKDGYIDDVVDIDAKPMAYIVVDGTGYLASGHWYCEECLRLYPATMVDKNRGEYEYVCLLMEDSVTVNQEYVKKLLPEGHGINTVKPENYKGCLAYMPDAEVIEEEINFAKKCIQDDFLPSHLWGKALYIEL